MRQSPSPCTTRRGAPFLPQDTDRTAPPKKTPRVLGTQAGKDANTTTRTSPFLGFKLPDVLQELQDSLRPVPLHGPLAASLRVLMTPCKVADLLLRHGETDPRGIQRLSLSGNEVAKGARCGPHPGKQTKPEPRAKTEDGTNCLFNKSLLFIQKLTIGFVLQIFKKKLKLGGQSFPLCPYANYLASPR